MPSKIVTDHQKLSEGIASALRTHGPAIAEAVRLESKASEDGRAVDVLPLLGFAQHEIEQRLAGLIAADNAHQHELSDDAAPRSQRDEAVATLYRAAVDLKRTTASLFGDEWVTKLAFPAEVSMDPAVLARTAAQVIEALGLHPLPKPVVPGVGEVEAGTWVALLQGPLAMLTEARAAVTREEDEARATRTARDAALAALVTANVNAAQLAQSLARIGKVLPLVDGLRGSLDRAGTVEAAPVAEPKSEE